MKRCRKKSGLETGSLAPSRGMHEKPIRAYVIVLKQRLNFIPPNLPNQTASRTGVVHFESTGKTLSTGPKTAGQMALPKCTCAPATTALFPSSPSSIPPSIKTTGGDARSVRVFPSPKSLSLTVRPPNPGASLKGLGVRYGTLGHAAGMKAGARAPEIPPAENPWVRGCLSLSAHG
jgi:hypothetical protein